MNKVQSILLRILGVTAALQSAHQSEIAADANLQAEIDALKTHPELSPDEQAAVGAVLDNAAAQPPETVVATKPSETEPNSEPAPEAPTTDGQSVS